MDLRKLVGSTLDQRYRLLRILGEGGSAVVFYGTDLLLSRPVAVKMLYNGESPLPRRGAPRVSPVAAGRTAMLSEDVTLARTGETAAMRAARVEERRRIARAAFVREAQAASRLAHPNIVTVYDVSAGGEHPYIVMEYVEGEALSAIIKEEGASPADEVLIVAEALLEALDEAHSHGVIHRDIKAQNILITAKGEVKITDFGIANTPEENGRILPDKILATADTVSPEAATGDPVDGRSDIYSLGVVLYQMATGRLPFIDDNPEAVAYHHIHDRPRRPSLYAPGLPRGLEELILAALEKDPARRPQSASAMLTAVRRLKKDPTQPLRFSRIDFGDILRRIGNFRLPIAIGLGVVAAILLGVLLIPLFGSTAAHPVTVIEISDVIGKTADTAKAEIEALDSRITVKIVEASVNDAALDGTVLSISPDKNTLLKLDGEDDLVTVTITVAKYTPAS